MNHPKVIANSLYWQEYILKASKDPKQKERALSDRETQGRTSTNKTRINTTLKPLILGGFGVGFTLCFKNQH